MLGKHTALSKGKVQERWCMKLEKTFKERSSARIMERGIVLKNIIFLTGPESETRAQIKCVPEAK